MTQPDGKGTLAASEPNLLIVGSAGDAHVSTVCERLPPSCVPIILDYSRYLKEFSAEVEYSNNGATLVSITSEMRTSLCGIERVWWRRPLRFQFPGIRDAEMREFLAIQCEFFWSSCVSSIPSRALWYNDWRLDYAVDRNANQLQRASRAGFSVPETLITSMRTSALGFIKRHRQVAIKNFGGSKSLWRPTRLVTIKELDEAWEKCVYPIIFQEYIEGIHDYRVTIVDDHLTAVEFDTGLSAYPYDVRVDPAIPCRLTDIGSSCAAALIELVKGYGLRYAAIDLRRRESGELVFLELNPAGQFLYLDQRAGTDIAGVVARALNPCT